MKALHLLCIGLLLLSACSSQTPTAESPSPQATRVASPTSIALEDTATPEPTPAVTPQATLAEEPPSRQQRIFEQLWNTVNTQYVYQDFNGLDWNQVYSDTSARIQSGLSDEAFWDAMAEMIDALGDNHSSFLSPERAREQDEQLNGNIAYVGIGIYAIAQIDKQQGVLLYVFPNSPAAEAGLTAHDAILEVEGEPIIAPDGADYLHRLRGESGSTVRLTVRSPGDAPREVVVERRRVDGTLSVSGKMLDESPGRRIGYMQIPTLWDASIQSSAVQTLNQLMSGGDLDGLIVDMRINGGGLSTTLLALLGHFTEGEQGQFTSRDGARPLTVFAAPIGNSQEVPLVVLVSEATESYAEVFSGVLREANRAVIVGNTTAGNIETIYGYDFEDGSRAWIARETFVPLSGEGWESIGVVPDVTVNMRWDEYTDANDPDIAAALDLLRQKAGATP
jgi:C-terminal peptidase prc